MWFGNWFGAWLGEVSEPVIYPGVEIIYVKPSVRSAEINRVRSAEIKLEALPSANSLVKSPVIMARPNKVNIKSIPVKMNRSKSINPKLYR